MENKETISTADIEIMPAVECAHCSLHVPESDTETTADNKEVCEACRNAHYIQCEDCADIVLRAEAKEDNYSNPVCLSCFEDNYFTCDRCECLFHNDNYGQDGYCEDCVREIEDNDDDGDGRHNGEALYSKGNEYVTEGKRAYSCEIECYYPDYSTMETVENEIPEGIGYTNDGSLDDDGKEFQTPKLSGEKGDDVLKALCETLNAHKFYVNKTCGLHIHLDTSDIAGNAEKIKTIILFYMAFEPVIYSFLPYSRRTSRYCLPLNKFYHEAEIENCMNVVEIEQIWYREQSRESIEKRKENRYDSSRYAGVNLHSLLSNGHIELRQHSGTIDYEKIKNWVELHTAILDRVSNGMIHDYQLTKIKHTLELNKKAEAMFELLELPTALEKYFRARAKKFGSEITENPLCAE